ncbi:hypothetical protein R3P38DRAFT_3206486 [Favolaschia claudopus]|uniref:Uncharacterized protein n=1 Tax=Favolaschia claudopus TaxID=2862362 RepID=A0AAW0AM81_9AGAR
MPQDFMWMLPPRLKPYDEDAAVFMEEPFRSAFTKQAVPAANYSLITEWLLYTLGAAIVDHMPEAAIRRSSDLFINVLYKRYELGNTPAGDQAALNLLLAAQMDNFREYYHVMVPPTYFAYDEALSARDSYPESEEDGESDAEAKEAAPSPEPMDIDSDDSDDPDYTSDMDEEDEDEDSMSDAESVSSDDLAELPAFVDSFESPSRPRVRKRPVRENVSLEERVRSWTKSITDFFYPDSLAVGPRDCTDVVNDLVEMRQLPQKIYETPRFLELLEGKDPTAGLFALMRQVARPGNLLENTHVDVTQSFRWYNWKVSYAALIERWVLPSMTKAEYQETLPPRPKKFQFSVADAQKLMLFISRHQEIHPWVFNPMAAYMFASLGAFTSNCESWLIPGLVELEYMILSHFKAANQWNIKTVYRQIKNLPMFTNPTVENLTALDPILATVVRETSKRRAFLYRLQQELYRGAPWADSKVSEDPDPVPPNPTKSPTKSAKRRRNRKVREQEQESAGQQERACPRCAHLKMEERCIRILEVTRQDCADLVGAALTCAPEGDRLQPKPMKPVPSIQLLIPSALTQIQKKGENGKMKPAKPVKFVHPFEDLNMVLVEHREDVYERCGLDIVRFVDKQTEKMIGGVRFQVFSDETLAFLIENHRLIKVVAIHRREDMQRWNPGTMTASGSRQPAGGYLGDGYGAYPSHLGHSSSEVRASCDALVEAGNSICPGLKSRLTNLTEESGIEYLGQSGLTLYDCTNYVSCIHIDKDMGLEDIVNGRSHRDALGDLAPTMQLEKTGCGKDDYNFGYVQWGIVVRTQANTVWIFNAQHEHGTVMPAASVVRQATSDGTHASTSGTNVLRAKRVKEIRCSYHLRTKVLPSCVPSS